MQEFIRQLRTNKDLQSLSDYEIVKRYSENPSIFSLKILDSMDLHIIMRQRGVPPKNVKIIPLPLPPRFINQKHSLVQNEFIDWLGTILDIHEPAIGYECLSCDKAATYAIYHYEEQLSFKRYMCHVEPVCLNKSLCHSKLMKKSRSLVKEDPSMQSACTFDGCSTRMSTEKKKLCSRYTIYLFNTG
jgi:hypothetical protein